MAKKKSWFNLVKRFFLFETLSKEKKIQKGKNKRKVKVSFSRSNFDGQDYGVHGFIVQLCSLDDHSPLLGITVGDIGMKLGSGAYNSMDNGVLRFVHVRCRRPILSGLLFVLMFVGPWARL